MKREGQKKDRLRSILSIFFFILFSASSITFILMLRRILNSSSSTMPKIKQKKRNSASQPNPYADAAAKTKAASSIFKMNTDIGQHILKNPGVCEKIVDKADLKQSDVRGSPE